MKEVSGEYDLVVADPFYSVSVLPWHNLLFWFQTNFLKDKGIVTGRVGHFKENMHDILCEPRLFYELNVRFTSALFNPYLGGNQENIFVILQ